MTENQRLVKTALRIQEDIIDYLEKCEYDLSDLITSGLVDDIAMEEAEKIRDDAADAKMEEERERKWESEE